MKLNRRSLLKGLSLGAGAVVLQPLVRQLQAHAAGLPARPARFLFVVLPNGLPASDIQPVGIPLLPLGKRTARAVTVEPIGDCLLHPSLKAIEAYKKRVTILQGLSGTCADAPSDGLGGHSSCWGSLGAYKVISSYVPAATIDGALGNKLGGLFRNLCLGVSKDPATSVVYDLTASGPGKKVPTQCLPSIAFKTLFGSVAGGKAVREFAIKTNLLDFMIDDVMRVEATVSGAEREKLDAHLNAYEAMRGRQAELERRREAIAKAAPPFTDKFTSPVETDRLSAQFDLAAAALSGGLTNVVTISCAAGAAFDQFTFTGLGITTGLHGIGHSSRHEDYHEKMGIIRTFLFEQIAGVMKKLGAIPEGSGTMLDNTLVVFTSDFGETHHAQRKEWPYVLIGDLGGRLTAGNVITYPQFGMAGHKTMNGLYTTLMHTVGEQPKTFGTPDLKLRGLDLDGPLPALLA